MLKTLMTVSTVLLTTAAFAQSNTKSPGSSEYAPGHKMQKSSTKGASEYAPGHQKNMAGPRPFRKRAGPSVDHRIGGDGSHQEEVTRFPAQRPGIPAGPLCVGACQQVRPFYRYLAALKRCDASMAAFPASGRFCVPLVTITFKTWVFRNFAMERPSRFASFESSEFRELADESIDDVATRQADEPVRNRPGPDQSRPDHPGPAAADRAEGRRTGPLVPRQSAPPAAPTTSSATPPRSGATRRRNGSSPTPSTSPRAATPATTTATWCG